MPKIENLPFYVWNFKIRIFINASTSEQEGRTNEHHIKNHDYQFHDVNKFSPPLGYEGRKALKMRKKYKEALKHDLENMNAERLSEIKEKLDKWQHNHALKKSSWFWGDNGNANQRGYKSRKYSFSEGINIGDVEICYYSDCSMSRQNVYWRDGLWVSDDDSIYVSFADVDFLMDAIDEILEDRETST